MTNQTTKPKFCGCCGQKVRKLNPHRMCSSKVQLLRILVDAGDWVRVQAGSGVYVRDKLVAGAPYRAQAHASRLEWFGLAEHGPARSGLYRVTAEGRSFLRGEHRVPAVLFCKDGKVVEKSDETVSLEQIKNVVLDKPYWDAYPTIQKDAA